MNNLINIGTIDTAIINGATGADYHFETQEERIVFTDYIGDLFAILNRNDTDFEKFSNEHSKLITALETTKGDQRIFLMTFMINLYINADELEKYSAAAKALYTQLNLLNEPGKRYK